MTREGGTVDATSADEGMLSAYWQETQRLLAHRVQAASIFFLLFAGAITTLEVIYFPTRRSALLLTCAVYAALCVAAVVAVRRRPDRTFAITVAATNALALCMTAYSAAVHNRAEMLVLTLTLYLTGVVLLFPWGLRGQALGSLGAALGYPLSTFAGATTASPSVYGLAALSTAVGLTLTGAYLLERHRFAAYWRAAELERAQLFSAALLEVARALNATIRDPQALAEQMAACARQALAADWAALLRWNESGRTFELAAGSGVPAAVAEEIRTIGFSPQVIAPFERTLRRNGWVALTNSESSEPLAQTLLQRWRLAAFLSQSIMREQQITAVVSCCYVQPRGPFRPQERRLLAAIANQAAVALENARLMEEARAANRLKSEFVATVSHELRTPLNVIIGYTDLLREAALGDPGEQSAALDRIRQQSLQLLDLIQAMLDVSRLDAGGLRLNLEEFDLGALFASLRTSVPSNWCGPKVKVDWLNRGGAATLRTDRGKLEMILRNLIHNALKYTEAGAVSVAAEEVGDQAQVCFSVTDTGPGIALEDQTAIFEMFRQASATPGRDGGVGLGLYIVKRLSEALGGSVSVHSQPGAGACFRVVLPRQGPRTAAG
ncbi:MAG: HAMP domain-containing histidine kinase [Deltaproteobacteria bacterium]|nr:HAMP domain-containing histidine kinase [Deltaproteobacteria bacterium]